MGFAVVESSGMTAITRSRAAKVHFTGRVATEDVCCSTSIVARRRVERVRTLAVGLRAHWARELIMMFSEVES